MTDPAPCPSLDQIDAWSVRMQTVGEAKVFKEIAAWGAARAQSKPPTDTELYFLAQKMIDDGTFHPYAPLNIVFARAVLEKWGK